MSHPYQPQDQWPQQPQPPLPVPQHQAYLPMPYAYPPVPTAPPKSPGVAVILQFLIPGLGHLYTGNPLWAIMWFLLAGFAWASLAVGVGFVLLPLVYLGAMFHGWASAADWNRRHHAVR